MNIIRIALCVAPFLAACPQAVIAQPGGVGDFASIKQRIAANCYDCAGSSETGLRSAVEDLERLVTPGFTPMEARRLLADSYREIALTYADRNSPEQMELLSRHRELYVAMLNDAPDSLDLLQAYVRVAEDPELTERLRVRTREALAEANFMSGALLFTRSSEPRDRATARERLQQAVDLATGPAKVSYGRRFADLLAGAGDNALAEEVLKAVDVYRREMGL